MKIEVSNRDSKSPVYTATVPCKVNLYLDVLGKREDGYHELDTVMLAVSLCDSVTFKPDSGDDIRIRVSFATPERLCDQDPAWDVPADERNLAVRALKLLASKLDCKSAGGELHIHKAIPAMAGLGGGSANAAAALVLGFMAWGEIHQWPAVLECAGQLGSDINFFLEGANEKGDWIARCQGRGEHVMPLPANLDALALVLVHPPAGCSTAQVFSLLNEERRGQNGDRLDSIHSVQRLLGCLKTGDVPGIGNELYNALQAPAEKVTDWISRAGKWMDRYDHFGQTMSGSGSASFCVCSSIEQAEIIERELHSLNKVRAFAVRPWHESRLQEQMQAIKGLSQ